MSATRRVKESPLYQGVDEQIAYTLTITLWGNSPTSVSVVMKNAAGADVSATYLSGSASVSGDSIVTPIVKSLVAGESYRMEIKFTSNGNIFEAYTDIVGET